MKKYEITLYNQDVRDHIRDDKQHPQFDHGWADQRFMQIEADTPEEAQKIINRRYPERKGFVIVNIIEIPSFT